MQSRKFWDLIQGFVCFLIFTAFKNANMVIYFYKYVKWNDLNKLKYIFVK